MLNPSDVYVEGGTDNLRVCWTDKVTKYDASSFYNWEQDNLPLHDLDERTDLLWERFGHPTSSLVGMSFVVSADATSSCYPTYFTSLSSCLEALPEVINCPILVEVASFGSLGTLKLSNKIFGPRGALEIINRNCGFGGAVDLDGVAMNYDTPVDTDTGYSLANSVSSFLDVSNPSVSWDAFNSYLYTNGNFIASASRYDDERYQLDTSPYVFTRRIGKHQNGLLTAALQSATDPWVNTSEATATSSIDFVAFERTAAWTGNANLGTTYDASTYSDIDTGLVWPITGLSDGDDPEDAVAAFAYFNYLDGIEISNCDGPIYIRNFNVDGSNSGKRGMSVINSKVNFERCSASRCTEAGLYAFNSDVILMRGFVAYRNYTVSGGTRIGVDYLSKSQSYLNQEAYGAGIFAENSTINFSSTYARDVEKASEASSLIYTAANYTGGLPAPSQEALFCLSRNDIGIHAVNSVIKGGRTELTGSSTLAWQDATQVISEVNTEAGVRLSNCTLDLDGRLSLYGNYFGLDANNSHISVDQYKAYGNQEDGIRLDGCSFIYNKSIYQGSLHTSAGQDYTTAKNDYEQHQVTLLKNGGGIYAKNSTILPVVTNSMPTLYQSFFVSGSHGVYPESSNTFETKPAIILEKSTLDAIHPSVYCVANGGRDEACYGQAIAAIDNSVVYLRGSGAYATKIIGKNTTEDGHQKAGVFVGGGSKVSIQGPTVIAEFGVDLLAEDNSKIEIRPPQDGQGILSYSGFTLSNSDNHTKVELHSSRACVVANKGSVFDVRDIGTYHDLWPVGTYGGALDLSRLDYMTLGQPNTNTFVSSVSGGYLQFFPNAFVETGLAPLTLNPAANLDNEEQFVDTVGIDSIDQRYLYNYDSTDEFSISGVTTGGMCVRALNQSKVNILNAHFPAGWPQASSVIYDFSGVDGLAAACTRLHIWNIADDSIMNASYLSVSGKHPQDAGYVGPSGNWYRASGAPAATPDTSSLSLLDYYGPDDDDQNIFGASSRKNFGAFRLYFSVDPLANYLVDPATVVSGYATQVFSQGYNFSGNLSTPGDVSAFYTKSLFSPEPYTISDAGFYYASSMVHSPHTIKAVVDDSAANTFANAKHNSVGKSGLANTVEIYEPYNTGIGGDSTSNKDSGKGVASVNNFDLRKYN